MKIEVGDRFEIEDRMPFTDERGYRVHYVKSVIEITKVDARNASYKTVKVVEEKHRPSFASDQTIVTGGFALDFAKEYLIRRVQ